MTDKNKTIFDFDDRFDLKSPLGNWLKMKELSVIIELLKCSLINPTKNVNQFQIDFQIRHDESEILQASLAIKSDGNNPLNLKKSNLCPVKNTFEKYQFILNKAVIDNRKVGNSFPRYFIEATVNGKVFSSEKFHIFVIKINFTGSSESLSDTESMNIDYEIKLDGISEGEINLFLVKKGDPKNPESKDQDIINELHTLNNETIKSTLLVKKEKLSKKKENENIEYFFKGVIDNQTFTSDSFSLDDSCPVNREFKPAEIKKLVTAMRATENIKHSVLFSHENCKIPSADKNVEQFTKYLNITLTKYNILSMYQRIHFLTQIYHESARLTTTLEFASGDQYNPGKRADAVANGNTEEGDGPRYKGRGLMQLTWRKTYISYFGYIVQHYAQYKDVQIGGGKTLDKKIRGDASVAESDELKISVIKETLNLRSHKYYELISDNLFFAFDSAGWFWSKYKKLKDNRTINDVSKNGIPQKTLVSKLVNGGANGLKERSKYFDSLLLIFQTEFKCKD